jgi:hypothetical protein
MERGEGVVKIRRGSIEVRGCLGACVCTGFFVWQSMALDFSLFWFALTYLLLQMYWESFNDIGSLTP